MIDKLMKGIIVGSINNIGHLDLTTDTIQKIRKDLNEFFKDLSKWTGVLKNLGSVIQSEFDKNSLVIYDEIMETVSVKFYQIGRA
jgi:hypothetical protein